MLFVRHVSWSDDQSETDPEEKVVDCEKGAVVEDDSGESDK